MRNATLTLGLLAAFTISLPAFADKMITEDATACVPTRNDDTKSTYSLGTLINYNPNYAYYSCGIVRVRDIVGNDALDPDALSLVVWMVDRNGTGADGYCAVYAFRSDGFMLDGQIQYSNANSTEVQNLRFVLNNTEEVDYYSIYCRLPGQANKASYIRGFEYREWF